MGKRGTNIVSVVMGVRDWPLDRLALAVRAHRQSSLGDALDVIVVDYGSANPLDVRRTVQAEGARVVRAEAGGRWNRAAALNFGIRQAVVTDWIVTTDPDILFAPTTIETVMADIESCGGRQVYGLVQCRDLPRHLTPEALQALPWDVMEESAIHLGHGGLCLLLAIVHRGDSGI
jgi:hypothetical protein